MTPNGTPIPLDTNSCKVKFATLFLRSLSRIKKHRSASSSSSTTNETQKCNQRIKMAAYSSMAHAVGSRRAWSRAVLAKRGSRGRRRQHGLIMKRKRSSWLGKKCKRVGKKKKCVSISAEFGQVNKLGKLVPGGKSMDILTLLEETSHYLTCLKTQVEVMETIADYYSKG